MKNCYNHDTEEYVTMPNTKEHTPNIKVLPSGGIFVTNLPGDFQGTLTVSYASDGELLDVIQILPASKRLVEIGSRIWIYADLVGKVIANNGKIKYRALSEEAARLTTPKKRRRRANRKSPKTSKLKINS